MDAVHYLRGRMELWLASAGTTDPIEFACSRHELRGAARALQEAGLLTAEDARTLLDEYDARLGEAGHLQRASAFMGASTSARAGGEGPQPARSRDPGRLERVITVAQPSDATPVGAALVGLLLEVWTDMVAFHYRSELEPSRHHGRGGPRWAASDDRNNAYAPLGSGAFSSRTGTRGVVEFAGRLPAHATRFVVRATNADGRPRACSSTCDPAASTSRVGRSTGRRAWHVERAPARAKQPYSQRRRVQRVIATPL